MPKLKLVAAGLGGLPIPEYGSTDYYDLMTPGLHLRVFESGRRTWHVKYFVRPRQRRRKLGDYPLLGLSEARKKAARVRADGLDGKDVIAEREERLAQEHRETEAVTNNSLGELITLYVDTWAAGKYAPSTVRELRRILLGRATPESKPGRFDDLADLRNVPANEVTDEMVADVLNRIEGRGALVMCNRTQTWLSAVYTWAAPRRLFGVRSNPVRGLPRRHNERTNIKRHLSAEELRIVLGSLDTTPGVPTWAATALWLITATGQRPGEVLQMRWSHLSLPDADDQPGQWRMPEGYRKRVRGQVLAPAHDVPLSALSVEKLRGRLGKRRGFVFGSAGTDRYKTTNALNQRVQRALLQHVKVDPFTPHDLRRTCRTHLSRMGVAPHVAEKLLGHVDSTVAGVYDRHEYWPERVVASDAWGERLRGIVAGAITE